MRKRLSAGVVVLALAMIGAAAAQGGGEKTSVKEFLGHWTGTWEGGGSGGIEMMLEQTKTGGAAGGVSVTGEPTYKATFKTVSFQGKQMSAKYDFPPDDNLEVTLGGTFDGNTAKGTWAVHGKNGGGEVAAGTWTVAKK